MTYEYGDTRNPTYAEEWERIVHALYVEAEQCRYCKSARTRARHHAEKLERQRDTLDVIAPARMDARIERAFEHAEKALCSKHGERLHLSYVTSPISETYWAS